MVRTLVILLALMWGAGSASEHCTEELTTSIETRDADRPATGVDAAKVMADAVELVEPALPPLSSGTSVPLEPGEDGYDAARFLADRDLLPRSWTPEAVPPEVWAEMLALLGDWYDLEVDLVGPGEQTIHDLVEDVAELIERIAPRLNPVAFVASRVDDRDQVALWAVVRNDSKYARMIIMRPPEPDAVLLDNGVEPILGSLGTCAMKVEKFVYAPGDTATRLFLAHNDSRMVVVESDAPGFDQLYYVPRGQETPHLAFEADDLDGANRYAAVFVGPPLSITAGLRIVPQLRTNMGPREILALLTMN